MDGVAGATLAVDVVVVEKGWGSGWFSRLGFGTENWRIRAVLFLFAAFVIILAQNVMLGSGGMLLPKGGADIPTGT